MLISNHPDIRQTIQLQGGSEFKMEDKGLRSREEICEVRQSEQREIEISKITTFCYGLFSMKCSDCD